LLPLLAASCASAPREEAGWRPIFDGRSLAGWTPKITGHALGEDPIGTFSVQGGAIRVSYDGYGGRFAGRFGHLAFERPVSAFRIRFDYRLTGSWLADVEPWQHSNSGLMFLAQPPETMARDQRFPVSMELQLLGPGGPLPTNGNVCTPGTHVVVGGRLETEHCIASPLPPAPNGQWVHVEVEVDRTGNITHFIGGVPAMRYGGAQYDPGDPEAQPLIAAAGGRLRLDRGWLYLQSEGHPVEFRNIALRELD
jgi:hypothetical protein